jgi:hypothetical protein
MCTQIKALRADSKLEEDGRKRIYELHRDATRLLSDHARLEIAALQAEDELKT